MTFQNGVTEVIQRQVGRHSAFKVMFDSEESEMKAVENKGMIRTYFWRLRGRIRDIIMDCGSGALFWV